QTYKFLFFCNVKILFFNFLLNDADGIRGRPDSVPIFLRVDFGKFRTEIKDGCRIIYPEQEYNNGSRRSISGRRGSKLHIDRDQKTAEHKQEGSKQSTPQYIPETHFCIGQYT